MNNKTSITALMSSFGRAFHAENEDHPVFADHLAKNLMTDEKYTAVQGYILGNAPMEVHRILLGAGVVLLEGIRLAEVSEGVYVLNAAPLNLSGADGSPCRAVLIATER